MTRAFLSKPPRERATDAPRAARDGDDLARDLHLDSPARNARDSMSHRHCGGRIPTEIQSLSSARRPRVRRRSLPVGRGHHADFAAAPRSGASILVMLVVAVTVRSVARRQRQSAAPARDRNRWPVKRWRAAQALSPGIMDTAWICRLRSTRPWAAASSIRSSSPSDHRHEPSTCTVSRAGRTTHKREKRCTLFLRCGDLNNCTNGS